MKPSVDGITSSPWMFRSIIIILLVVATNTAGTNINGSNSTNLVYELADTFLQDVRRSNVIAMINCGSNNNYNAVTNNYNNSYSHIDPYGNQWLHDMHFTNGDNAKFSDSTANQTIIDVGKTKLDTIYRTVRSGFSFQYNIPVVDRRRNMTATAITNISQYTIYLLFADMHFSNPNDRIVNITVGQQGSSTSSTMTIDPIREAPGPKVAITKRFIVDNVSYDGILNVKITSNIVNRRAFLSGIFVVQGGSGGSGAVLSRPPTASPTASPTMSYQRSSKWIEIDANASLTARHEACFVMVGRKGYLIGGRTWLPVNIYDPETNTWTNGTQPPVVLHHMQCVAVDGKVWIVAAWTGWYPKETNIEYIYIYDPMTDTWSTKDALPEERRRGGGAVVVVNRRIYVSHGNRGGHETGNHSVSLAWLDYFDIATNTWVTNLPDGIYPRDHTGGALIGGNRICIAGGRDGGTLKWPSVAPTECFNIDTNRWEIEANITQVRAGAAYGTSCDNRLLLIAGGEGSGRAWNRFDAFDGKRWIQLSNLTIGRHGTGLAVDCQRNSIFIASGAAAQGGGPEIRSVERFDFL